jgi:hypothetical protein
VEVLQNEAKDSQKKIQKIRIDRSAGIRDYKEAVRRNSRQNPQSPARAKTPEEERDPLPPIVKKRMVHDTSPLVRVGFRFDLTLRAQQTPALSVRNLIERIVKLKPMDISTINRMDAIVTIKENQMQQFMKVKGCATLRQIPKWSSREELTYYTTEHIGNLFETQPF